MGRRIGTLLLALLWIPLGAAASAATLTSLVLEESPTSGLQVTYDEVLTEDLMTEMGLELDMTNLDGHIRGWSDGDRTIVLMLVDGERADPQFSAGFLVGTGSAMEEQGSDLLEWPDVEYPHVVSSVGSESFSAAAGDNGFGIYVLAVGPEAEIMAKATVIAQISLLPERIVLQDSSNPLDSASRLGEVVGRVLFFVLVGAGVGLLIRRHRRAKNPAADGPTPEGQQWPK